MSKSDTLVHELRTLAGELRQVYEHSTDWLRDEAVTLASSVDCMREAADTIESLRDRLQAVQGVGDETNYDKLFGTPERAAVTLVRTSDERAVCKLPTWTASSNDYEAWLDWLRGDAE